MMSTEKTLNPGNFDSISINILTNYILSLKLLELKGIKIYNNYKRI